MNKVSNLFCNNKLIEITPYTNGRYYIYNTYNNRTIIGDAAVIEYLYNNPEIDSYSELYDFITNKKKKNILDFKFFDISLESEKLRKISGFTKFSNNVFVVLFSLFITIYYIFGIISFDTIYEETFHLNEKFLHNNLILLMILLICAELLITFLHELSHFYYYQLYFKNKYVKLGVSLRYFSLFLFSTSVPFMDLMDKKKKLQLISAGIKTQITLSGILTVFLLIFNDFEYLSILHIIYLSNIFLILINIIPFLRLDGFWYISCYLNVNNYMNEYKNIFLKKSSPNIGILFIGTLNILIILGCIFSAFSKIFLFFIKN